MKFMLAALLLVAAAAAQEKPVVRFYGESLCPFCQQAVQYLQPNVIEKAGVVDIMDFQYVAYGNAQKEGGKIVCQHGPQECLGNRAEECARNQTNYKPAKYFPFVYALEQGGAITDATIASAAKKTNLDAADIAACVAGKRADELIAKAAKETPTHPGVPWFLYNGKELNDYTTLLSRVCEDWKGKKPAGCSSVLAKFGRSYAEN